MIRSKMKKWIAAGMAAVLVTAIAPWNLLNAKADEGGRLDPFTGEPIGTIITANGTYTDQNRKMLSSTMYYDYNYGSFVYPVSNGLSEITANIADGMIVNSPVQINVPRDIAVTLYRNGNEEEFTGEVLRSTGEYTLRYTDGNKQTTVLSFTIVGSATGLISGYTMPSGFRIKKVYHDQEEGIYSRSYVSLEEEGLYTIEYECEKTGINYSLMVRIDNTPPEVTLDGVKEDGKARGPVTINGLSNTDKIYITKDGENYKYTSNKLTSSGRYVVRIADEAENTVEYAFTIMIYIDTSGTIFLIVVFAVVAAVVAFVLLKRKNLRVR